jgi:SAM-dependent methyltransferase
MASTVWSATVKGVRGDWPERYATPLVEAFWNFTTAEYRPGMAILDCGSGRRPTIAIEDRPADCTYWGLDISANELDLAPEGSYDHGVVSDVTTFAPELVDKFDLIVSFYVFEHVKPLDAAIENLRRYLKPGGVLVTQMSGRYSFFAVANRVLPNAVTSEILVRFTQRDPETIFPAWYDQCSYRGLSNILANWTSSEIVSIYAASRYLESRFVRGVYLGLEEVVVQRDMQNLASDYVVRAVR